jgi:hypothetical protein
MKINQLLESVLKESFEWISNSDKEAFMSLKGLVNNNNGVWKSTKQRWFVTNKILGPDDLRSDSEKCKDFFGVSFTPPQKLVVLQALTIWAEYGNRSKVPVFYGFVLDDNGVVAFYKIGTKGNLAIGAGPDPKKTKKEWSRPDNVDTSHLVDEPKPEDKPEINAGEYLGEIGKRINVSVELVYSKYQESKPVSWNVSTDVFWNVYKDTNGNIIYHTGSESPIKVGEKGNMTATVRKQAVNKKGEKVTTVMRPRFVNSPKDDSPRSKGTPKADNVKIEVTYSSIDHYEKTSTFKTLAGAQKFAQKYVGPHPDMGMGYAVSNDGVGKIEVYGCSIKELFPENES